MTSFRGWLDPSLSVDPMSALGLAGNVVQFVDFASKLIAKGNKYYNAADGALVEHTELKTAARCLKDLRRVLGTSRNGPSTLSAEEQALDKVIHDCNDIASEIVDVLNQLRVSETHQKWKSFRQVFKTVWNKEKVEEMLRRLDMAQMHFIIHFLVCKG